jgi:hypothetical protein
VAPHAILPAERLVRLVRAQKYFRCELAVVGMNGIEPAETERLVANSACKLDPAWVDIGAVTHGIGGPNHHGRMIGHIAKSRFAFAQRLLIARPLLHKRC